MDKVGHTIDFYLSKQRDAASAKHFFSKAIRSSGKPEKINIDKSGSNIAALNNIKRSYKPKLQIKMKQNKYLNNQIDHERPYLLVDTAHNNEGNAPLNAQVTYRSEVSLTNKVTSYGKDLTNPYYLNVEAAITAINNSPFNSKQTNTIPEVIKEIKNCWSKFSLFANKIPSLIAKLQSLNI